MTLEFAVSLTGTTFSMSVRAPTFFEGWALAKKQLALVRPMFEDGPEEANLTLLLAPCRRSHELFRAVGKAA